MSLQFRETDMRGLIGVIYPSSRGIQPRDRWPLLELFYVAGVQGAITANLKTNATIRGRVNVTPTIPGKLEVHPQRP